MTLLSDTTVKTSELNGSPFSSTNLPGSTLAVPSALIVMSGGMIFTVLPFASVTTVGCSPSNESVKLCNALSITPSLDAVSSPVSASTAVLISTPVPVKILSSPGSDDKTSANSSDTITIGVVSDRTPS